MSKKDTVFTQKNTVQLIELIQRKELNPRNLRRKERLQVVAFLRNEGKSGYEIARFLNFCDKTIWNDIKLIKRNAAYLVDEISIKRVAGDLIREADVLINKAKNGLDYTLAWRIKCDLIEKLQSMGFVYKAPAELKHSGEIKGVAEQKIFALIINKKDEEINNLLTSRPLLQLEKPKEAGEKGDNSDSGNGR